MGGDKDLIRWLIDYENRRLNPDARSRSTSCMHTDSSVMHYKQVPNTSPTQVNISAPIQCNAFSISLG